MVTGVLWIMAAAALGAQEAPVVEHVIVYKEPGRFGGWPANHGMWAWGDELLVGFSVGYFKDLGPEKHAIDREKPEEPVLARSLDGGKTWSIEHPNAKHILAPRKGVIHGTVAPNATEPDAVDCPGGVSFTHPDFAMTLRMSDLNEGTSRLYYSYDRGKDWKGPFKVPLFGQKGIAARTDYVVDGPHDCTVFLTASKSNGKEGRVLCARTTDGAKTWKMLSFIGPEPEGYSIMPSSVRVSETSLLTTIRRRDGDPSWIEEYRSDDNGVSWTFVNRPVPSTGEGNPPALLKLRDGRLCLIYGYRAAPFAICARLSTDGGKTWGEAITLRGNAGGRDIGYPRAIQRPDGKVVCVYYICDDPNKERYIEAAVWDPAS
ncbi:MAG: exo-alpha-sialidase [Candidatus Hydrogenedentes bacterium]|nr:exo-alpha-sialidase [Candidatus Hydrogenedentota bacterium]